MEDDSLVGSICDKTGISKRSIAGLTGTHHSMLVRFNAGTHGLPARLMPALLQLFTAVNKLDAPSEPQPSADDIEALQQQAAWCVARCYLLRKKLAAMQKLYTQGTTTLELLLTRYNTKSNNPKLQRWIEQQRYEANKKVEQNGWAAQFKLTKAIALLEQEAEMCGAVVSRA